MKSEYVLKEAELESKLKELKELDKNLRSRCRIVSGDKDRVRSLSAKDDQLVRIAEKRRWIRNEITRINNEILENADDAYIDEHLPDVLP